MTDSSTLVRGWTTERCRPVRHGSRKRGKVSPVVMPNSVARFFFASGAFMNSYPAVKETSNDSAPRKMLRFW